MVKVKRPFCWHQNFIPWGLSAPAPGLYACIKPWKNCMKSDFKEIILKLVTNDQSDKMFLLTSKFHPQGVVIPCPGAIYMYKIIKNCIKFRDFFFKLVANDWSDERFLLTIKFVPCGYIDLLNHEKMCIKSEVEEILFQLATKDHRDEAFLLT